MNLKLHLTEAISDVLSALEFPKIYISIENPTNKIDLNTMDTTMTIYGETPYRNYSILSICEHHKQSMQEMG